MPQELIYTSAPRGLKPGTQGFCTVVSTQGMPGNLALQLESLSGYRHLFPPGTPEEEQNPVVYSHLRLRTGGVEYHVVSRIGSAGVDYSRRSNKLAHHVVLKEAELPASGPAWLMSQPGFLQSRWDGQVRLLPRGRSVPPDPKPIAPQVCHTWQRWTGDAGWAGLLAETALTGQPAVLVFPVGADPLPLLAEALALLPPELRWKVTFTTYYLGVLPSGIECQWRCVFQGTPEELPARRTRGALVLDLTRPMGLAPASDAVEAARQGKWIRPPTPEPVVRSRPTSTAEKTAWPVAPLAGMGRPSEVSTIQPPVPGQPLPPLPDKTLAPEVPLPGPIIYGFRRKRRLWLWVLPVAVVALALLLGIGVSLWLRWGQFPIEISKRDTQGNSTTTSALSTQGKKADSSQTPTQQTGDSDKPHQTKGTSESKQQPGGDSKPSAGATASDSQKPKGSIPEHSPAGERSSSSRNTSSEKAKEASKPEEKSQTSSPPLNGAREPSKSQPDNPVSKAHQPPEPPGGKSGSQQPEPTTPKRTQQSDGKPPHPEPPAAKPKRYWLPIPDWNSEIRQTGASPPVKIPLPEHLSSNHPQTLRLEWAKPKKLDAFQKLKNAEISWAAADQRLTIHEKDQIHSKPSCSFTLHTQERPPAVHFEWASPVPQDWPTWQSELADSLLLLKEGEMPLAYIQLRQAPKLEPLPLNPGTLSMGVRNISTKIPIQELTFEPRCILPDGTEIRATKIPIQELTFEPQLQKPPGERLRKDSSNPNPLPTFLVQHDSEQGGKSAVIEIYIDKPPLGGEISINWKYHVTVPGLTVSQLTINDAIRELNSKIKEIERQIEKLKNDGNKPGDCGKSPAKEKSQYEQIKRWLEKWCKGTEIHFCIYHIVKDDKEKEYRVYVGFTDERMLPGPD
jgi:hypothetical protein